MFYKLEAEAERQRDSASRQLCACPLALRRFRKDVKQPTTRLLAQTSPKSEWYLLASQKSQSSNLCKLFVDMRVLGTTFHKLRHHGGCFVFLVGAVFRDRPADGAEQSRSWRSRSEWEELRKTNRVSFTTRNEVRSQSCRAFNAVST